jgi:hypothetical protein
MLDILKTIFTDWLPSLAIVVGGGFAWWRWHHTERLRRLKEIPSAEGSLAASPIRVGKKVLVQLDAVWNNPSPLPFEVDTKETVIDVLEVSDELEVGFLQVRHGTSELGRVVHSAKPLKHLKSFRLEPGTKSLVQTHFALAENQLLLFRWKLYRKDAGGRKLSRPRFLLLDTRTLQSTRTLEEADSVEEEE